MRHHAAAVVIAFSAAVTALGVQASPVSAECPYLPPWPDITPAIPTARKIVVGEIVTDFVHADLHLGPDQGPRDHALRVTEVLRGEARPGDLVDMQYLQANWPQIRFPDMDGTLASCTYLRAAPGEVIALAFDALRPGGPMSNGDYKWIHPPTRYNAVGVIKGPGGNAGTSHYRQPVTLQRLRALAALPPTDTAAVVPRTTHGPGNLLLPALVGLVLGIHRFGTARAGAGGWRRAIARRRER